MSDKAQLRKAFLARRREIAAKDVGEWSAAIVARVLALPEFARARVVYSYVAVKNEACTQTLIHAAIAQGKTVCCPRVAGDELAWGIVTDLDALERGGLGILEPAADALPAPAASGMDCCLVPAVAVRGDGHRLGQGSGYYDRFLHDFPGPRIALAYAWQWTEAFEPEAHDIAVDIVVSEREVLRCGGK